MSNILPLFLDTKCGGTQSFESSDDDVHKRKLGHTLRFQLSQKLGHSDIKANTESEGSNKDAEVT